MKAPSLILAMLVVSAWPAAGQAQIKPGPLPPAAAPAPRSEVAATVDLNQSVLAYDQAIVAANAQAQASYEAQVEARAEEIKRIESDQAAAVAAYDQAVIAQQAGYEQQMAAWRAQVEACRLGDANACRPR